MNRRQQAEWFGALLIRHWGGPVLGYAVDTVRDESRRRGGGTLLPYFSWDAPQGVIVVTPKNPNLCVSFLLEGAELCLVQAQTTEKAPIWFFEDRVTVSPRVKVLQVAQRVASELDLRLSTPDGSPKVEEIADCHGGFSLEEHKAMGWEEWGEGEIAVGHILKVYNTLPRGAKFGPEITFLDGAVRARRIVQ